MTLWDFMDQHFVRVAIATIILVAVVGHYTREILIARGREQTRRDLAAYLAEGSIRPEDVLALLPPGESSAVESITDAVAMGILSPEKAESLVRALRAKPEAAAEASLRT